MAQPGQRERAEQQAKVAQSDVEVAGDGEKIQNDNEKPDSHDVGKDSRLEKHTNPSDDLDHADRQHELVTMAANQIVSNGREVFVPVDEQVKELVEAGQYRLDGEGETENLERLIGISTFGTAKCAISWSCHIFDSDLMVKRGGNSRLFPFEGIGKVEPDSAK